MKEKMEKRHKTKWGGEAQFHPKVEKGELNEEDLTAR